MTAGLTFPTADSTTFCHLPAVKASTASESGPALEHSDRPWKPSRVDQMFLYEVNVHRLDTGLVEGKEGCSVCL